MVGQLLFMQNIVSVRGNKMSYDEIKQVDEVSAIHQFEIYIKDRGYIDCINNSPVEKGLYVFEDCQASDLIDDFIEEFPEFEAYIEELEDEAADIGFLMKKEKEQL